MVENDTTPYPEESDDEQPEEIADNEDLQYYEVPTNGVAKDFLEFITQYMNENQNISGEDVRNAISHLYTLFENRFTVDTHVESIIDLDDSTSPSQYDLKDLKEGVFFETYHPLFDGQSVWNSSVFKSGGTQQSFGDLSSLDEIHFSPYIDEANDPDH